MSIYEKLLSVQKEIGAIHKDSKNPFYKSAYFDINSLLDAVKPILNKNGLIVLQPLSNIDGVSAIKTILYDVESGETIGDIVPLPQNPDPQKMGSAITYYRRYLLQSLLCLQGEDDDANFASKGSNLNANRQTQKSSVKPQVKKDMGTERLKLRIVDGFKKMNYQTNHKANTIKKYLGTKTVDECSDFAKLNSLYQHLLEKAKKGE